MYETHPTGVWIDNATGKVVYEKPAEGHQVCLPGAPLTPKRKADIQRALDTYGTDAVETADEPAVEEATEPPSETATEATVETAAKPSPRKRGGAR